MATTLVISPSPGVGPSMAKKVTSEPVRVPAEIARKARVVGEI